jgi:hypothetical protein
MPESSSRLPFERTFSQEECDRISWGFIPVEMEDKWFVFLEDDELFLHRSWTGYCIYQLRLQRGERGYSVVEAWVNRDPSQYGNVDDGYDAALLGALIDNLLLGKRTPIPVPEGIPKDAAQGFYQHHVAGRAYSGAGGPTKPPLLQRLRRFFRRR